MQFNEKLKTLIGTAQKQTGLTIVRLKTRDELAAAGRLGLYDAYCDIFAEAPYREKFNPQDVKNYFEEMREGGGIIFAAFQYRKGGSLLLRAFNASTDISQKPAVLDYVRAALNSPDKSAYFAEDAVMPEQRRQGISRAMKYLLLSANSAFGYENMLLRTSADSANQIAASKQLGAVQIEGLSQDVESLRLDGTTRPDRRVFFQFDLRGFA